MVNRCTCSSDYPCLPPRSFPLFFVRSSNTTRPRYRHRGGGSENATLFIDSTCHKFGKNQRRNRRGTWWGEEGWGGVAISRNHKVYKRGAGEDDSMVEMVMCSTVNLLPTWRKPDDSIHAWILLTAGGTVGWMGFGSWASYWHATCRNYLFGTCFVYLLEKQIQNK